MSPAADVGIYDDEEEEEEGGGGWGEGGEMGVPGPGGAAFSLCPASCNAIRSPTSNSTSGYQSEIFFN